MDSLVVTCRRGDIKTTAAVIVAYQDRIEIAFGRPSGLGGVDEIYREIIYLADNPEIASIRDRTGWNISEINALISGLEFVAPIETRI